jgi:hypothetical protein
LPAGIAHIATADRPARILPPHCKRLLLLLRATPLDSAPLQPLPPPTAAAAAAGDTPLLLRRPSVLPLRCSAATPQPSFSTSDQSMTSVLSIDCMSSHQAGKLGAAAAAAVLLLVADGGSM